jgi:hypothetical protein
MQPREAFISLNFGAARKECHTLVAGCAILIDMETRANREV